MSTAITTTTTTPSTDDTAPLVIQPRRKNVVSIELTEAGKALAVLLNQTEVEMVTEAVRKHVDEATAKIRPALLG